MFPQGKLKILIAGIGAVGGYFGGLLARRYEEMPEVEIIFYARGSHLTKIQENGLKVIGPKGEFVCRPALATNDPAEIGEVDYILVSTKSYGLQSIIEELKPCISERTHVVSLLNGVDAKGTIKAIVPQAKVFDGCVYIVSRIIEDGVVHNKGNIERLFFGTDSDLSGEMRCLHGIMMQAGMDAHLTDEISRVIWEKFIFISAAATSTSYFDKSIGAVMKEDDSHPEIMKLLDEIISVGQAAGIQLRADIKEKATERLNSLSHETTSSMHSDFQAGRQTEISSLTEYVIKKGAELNVPTPTYLLMFDALKN